MSSKVHLCIIATVNNTNELQHDIQIDINNTLFWLTGKVKAVPGDLILCIFFSFKDIFALFTAAIFLNKKEF